LLPQAHTAVAAYEYEHSYTCKLLRVQVYYKCQCFLKFQRQKVVLTEADFLEQTVSIMIPQY